MLSERAAQGLDRYKNEYDVDLLNDVELALQAQARRGPSRLPEAR